MKESWESNNTTDKRNITGAIFTFTIKELSDLYVITNNLINYDGINYENFTPEQKAIIKSIHDTCYIAELDPLKIIVK